MTQMTDNQIDRIIRTLEADKAKIESRLHNLREMQKARNQGVLSLD